MRVVGWYAGIVFGLIGLGSAGCNEPPEKPKRADDQAAHAHHYHPDVERLSAAASQPGAAASQPGEPDAVRLFAPGGVGSPVMFVNGDSITVSEILEPLIDELAKQSKALAVRDYQDAAIRLVRSQIDYQTSALLVYQQARLKYSDKKYQEAFDKRADQLVKEMVNARFGGVYARYETHLKRLDMAAADMKERIKRDEMIKEYFRERFRPLLTEPARRELMNYYRAHLADYTTPERAELFLIEVPVEGELGKPRAQASDRELTAARERARARCRRAREELDSGVEFSAVAKTYSRDAMTHQGGAWGEVSPGALTRRWARPGEVLFTLQSGRVSDLIETDEAFFIVKCGRRTPAQQTSFEDAQRKIMDRLLEEQFNRLRNEYIRQLLGQATIRKRTEFFQAVLMAVPRPPEVQSER